MPRASLIGLVALLAVPRIAAAQAPVVLLHGAWGGGWDWKTVESELRAHGREVRRATLTGLGERSHLASPDIGLDTHVMDVVNLILYENLTDVVLVGHSYGGMVITGVAEKIPERIGHLVYVDAILPFDGECVMSTPNQASPTCDPAAAAARRTVGTVVDGLLVPPWVPEGAPPPKDVPHPFKTFTDPVHLAGAPGHGQPASYILTRDAPGQPDGFDWAAERARGLGWQMFEITSGHNAQREAPDELARMILLSH